MNNEILSDYCVNKETLALLAAYAPDYDTIVIEADRELKIRKTPLQLIKQACLSGGASYAGRRDAVRYLTGAKNKVPIPVYPDQKIYAFPTKSPKQYECCWIFYDHIHTIKQHRFQDHSIGTMIIFKNGRQLPLSVSLYTIEKQIHRTSQCMLHFPQTLYDFVKSYYTLETPYYPSFLPRKENYHETREHHTIR